MGEEEEGDVGVADDLLGDVVHRKRTRILCIYFGGSDVISDEAFMISIFF